RDQRDPAHDDGQRQPADPGRDEAGAVGGDLDVEAVGGRLVGTHVAGVRGHADFSMQYVWAFTPVETLSTRSSPSTMMRQPMWSALPCATMCASADGAVVLRVMDQGRVTSLTRWVRASRSR